MPAISRFGSLIVLPLMLVGLVAASTLVSTPAADAASRNTKISRAVRVALHQIGDPYRYGAAGPNAFDCSGLVYYSYRKAGFRHVPRTSDDQARWGHKVRKSHLRRGDLMFFHSGGNVYHAAIFLKRNRKGTVVMLDSAKPGTRVHRRHPFTKQWFGRSLRH